MGKMCSASKGQGEEDCIDEDEENDLNNDDEAFDQPEKQEKPKAAIEETNNYQL